MPEPPPVLLAGVGVELAPPIVAVGWWLGVGDSRFETVGEEGVAILFMRYI